MAHGNPYTYMSIVMRNRVMPHSNTTGADQNVQIRTIIAIDSHYRDGMLQINATQNCNRMNPKHSDI